MAKVKGRAEFGTPIILFCNYTQAEETGKKMLKQVKNRLIGRVRILHCSDILFTDANSFTDKENWNGEN